MMLADEVRATQLADQATAAMRETMARRPDLAGKARALMDSWPDDDEVLSFIAGAASYTMGSIGLPLATEGRSP